MRPEKARSLRAKLAVLASPFGFLARLAAALLLLSEPRMLAQCAMCRTALAAQGAHARTLNAAILILLLPALALFSAVFLLAFRCPEAPSSDNRSDDVSR